MKGWSEEETERLLRAAEVTEAMSRDSWFNEVRTRRDEIEHLITENQRFTRLVEAKKSEVDLLEEKVGALRREWRDLDELLVTRVKRLTTIEEEWLSVAEEVESGILSKEMTRLLTAKVTADQNIVLLQNEKTARDILIKRQQTALREAAKGITALEEELKEFHEWKHTRKPRGGKGRVDSM